MNKMLLTCLGIAIAGSVGALARFGITMGANVLTGTSFPVGTLIINVTGAFFLGWVNTSFGNAPGSDIWRLILGVGFLGAFTTFSSMMFETNKMMSDAAFIAAASYVAGSLFLGLLAVRLGILVGRM